MTHYEYIKRNSGLLKIILRLSGRSPAKEALLHHDGQLQLSSRSHSIHFPFPNEICMTCVPTSKRMKICRYLVGTQIVLSEFALLNNLRALARRFNSLIRKYGNI